MFRNRRNKKSIVSKNFYFEINRNDLCFEKKNITKYNSNWPLLFSLNNYN